AAAGSRRTVSRCANEPSIDDGRCGSGSAFDPNAAAIASALDSPEASTTAWRARATAGKVIDTRGTNGSCPASGTPTTRRDRTLVAEPKRCCAEVKADRVDSGDELLVCGAWSRPAGEHNLPAVRGRPDHHRRACAGWVIDDFDFDAHGQKSLAASSDGP